MKSRRNFLLKLTGAVALPSVLLKATPKNGIAIANEFAAAYKEWGALYEKHIPGTYSIPEVRAWKQVKENYSTLRKYIDLDYEQ